MSAKESSVGMLDMRPTHLYVQVGWLFSEWDGAAVILPVAMRFVRRSVVQTVREGVESEEEFIH